MDNYIVKMLDGGIKDIELKVWERTFDYYTVEDGFIPGEKVHNFTITMDTCFIKIRFISEYDECLPDYINFSDWIGFHIDDLENLKEDNFIDYFLDNNEFKCEIDIILINGWDYSRFVNRDGISILEAIEKEHQEMLRVSEEVNNIDFSDMLDDEETSSYTEKKYLDNGEEDIPF